MDTTQHAVSHCKSFAGIYFQQVVGDRSDLDQIPAPSAKSSPVWLEAPDLVRMVLVWNGVEWRGSSGFGEDERTWDEKSMASNSLDRIERLSEMNSGFSFDFPSHFGEIP